jgi:hypothetical protein
MVLIPDPRIWPDPTDAPEFAARLHALANASLGAATARDGDGLDAELEAAFAAMIEANEGPVLAATFDSAPSADVYRHL